MNKRKRGPVYGKLDHEYVRRLGVVKRPTLDYSWRRGAQTNNIPSLEGPSSPDACVVRSVMDPIALAKESPETRSAIISKSKRIAPAYNKGAAQYLSDEIDPKTIGRK